MRDWRPLAVAGAVAAAALWNVRRGDDLTGEVALVTGGSRGLGFLIADRLLREGCRVVICARDPETLDRARERLRRQTAREPLALPCDVADPDAVAWVVDEVLARYDRLDILVNNAAVIQVGPLEALGLADFREAMEIGYFGVLHATLATLPHMRRRRHGRIVNITSVGGKVAAPHLLPYDAAKFAAIGLSEGLRAELSGSGIAVTTVVPGLMRTGSPIHVDYRGQPAREYRWFATADVVPLSAMSADRAADRVVRALRRREAEVVLSWQARLIRVLHDLAPGTTARVLGRIARWLPGSGQGAVARGTELRGALPDALESALDRAAARANQ